MRIGGIGRTVITLFCVGGSLACAQNQRRWPPPSTSTATARATPRPAATAPASIAERHTLRNGVRVALVPLPGSEQISVALVAPLGLCCDDEGRTLWSEMLETLVRSTPGSPLAADMRSEVNADCITLAFHRPASEWKQAIAIPARWLTITEFKANRIRAVGQKLLEEIRASVEYGRTHIYALAAWSQAVRFDRKEINLRDEIKAATPEEMLRYYQQRFLAGPPPVIAICGKFDAQQVLAELEARIGGITLPPAPPPLNFQRKPPASRPAATAPADLAMIPKVVWDQPTQHYFHYWPSPGPADHDHPVLLVGAKGCDFCWEKFQRPYLYPGTRNLCDADVRLAGQYFMVINMPMRDVTLDSIRGAYEDQQMTVDALSHDDGHQSRKYSLDLWTSQPRRLTPELLPLLLAAANKQNIRAQSEAEMATFMGLFEFRYGGRMERYLQELDSMTDRAMQDVYKRHLPQEFRHELLLISRNPASAPATRPGMFGPSLRGPRR